MKNKRLLTTAIGFGLLGAAVIGAVIFVKTRPVAQRKQMSAMVPVVEVMSLQSQTLPARIECLGLVIPDAAVELQTEVSGQIVKTHPDMDQGSFVQKGELLLEIDPRDYELAVKRAEANLLSAQSSLRLEEGQQSVALHERELIGLDASVDQDYEDLMLREPQLKAAQAAVEVAQAALDAAHLDLERTQIRAPFDAVVREVNVDAGDFASAGNKVLVSLVATRRFFVRASLPIDDLRYFPNLEQAMYSALVMPGSDAERNGTLYKLLPGLSEQGRMARVLIAVENPMGKSDVRPLLLDEMVRVQLSGILVEDVCLIPRKYLRAGSTVWMMDEAHQLQICPAEVVQGYADRVLVRVDFSEGWQLVTSNLAAPVDGMQLKTVADAGGEPQE